MARVVVERLSAGSAGSAPERIDAPSVAGIHIEFGVGTGPTARPSADDFKPVYTITVPVFALGALDSDGVHEVDAAGFLEMLQTRATNRQWAARLVLEFRQTPAMVNAADLVVDTDHADGGPEFRVADKDPRGTTVAGGARSVTLHSTPAHDRAGVEALGGKFELVADAGDKKSSPRQLRVALGRFEFQPG